MAMILKAAVENDLCREVMSAHTYTTPSTEEHPEGISWFSLTTDSNSPKHNNHLEKYCDLGTFNKKWK